MHSQDMHVKKGNSQPSWENNKQAYQLEGWYTLYQELKDDLYFRDVLSVARIPWGK